MAHEIKNPLTPIQLSAERLQAKLADKLEGAARESLTKAVATIVGQVAAMKGLVDAFAQYARLPSPKISRLDLNGLLDEVLHLYETALHIDLALTPGLPPVAADPALLRQLVVNLVKNAQEATLDVASPALRVHSRQNGERVEFCFEDNGPGFPPELRERLFEPYATTKVKGTGLGLAVVKKIVDEHHGTISVDSAESGGARVCVSLPALEEDKGT
jgi:nitrogen fixation/metabolism regulation signal transduction histidine kinase